MYARPCRRRPLQGLRPATILNSGQHLLALITDILDMSKIEAGKMNLRFEPVALEDVAEDALRLVRNRADAAGLALRLDFNDLPDVEADYRAIKQVLLNLLTNAAKFTEARRPDHCARRAARRSAGRARVVDQRAGHRHRHPAGGPRPPRPALRTDRKPARQDLQQGTGLGLALTKLVSWWR